MKSRTNRHAEDNQNAGELIANISKLMAEAEEMLSESTSQHAEETVELLRPVVYYDGGWQPDTTYFSARTKFVSAAQRTGAAIRRYPYESVAMALGLGFLVGAFCCRRRN